MSKNLNSENGSSLSQESINALMEQAGDAIKKSVPAQSTEEPTVVVDEQDSENGDDTEKTSKLEGLKTKALGFLKKNKKFLISTGAVVALGVIVKVALGQPTDEEEPVKDCNDELCDDCKNHETSEV